MVISKQSYDLFLSYNTKDIEAVNLLASALIDSGVRVWYDRWELIPGKQWQETVNEALNQCTIIGICIGPNGIGTWNKDIIELTLSEKGLKAEIIVILLSGADLSLLHDIQLNYQVVNLKDAIKAIDKIKWIIASIIEGGSLFHRGSKIIWNVPYLRNPNFIGRESLITKLRESLVSRKEVALVQVLTGLGGVGKTQLAVEYAYRCATDYDIVWWVRAEEQNVLANDYLTLARELELIEKDLKDREAAVTALRRELELRSRWLLIFDGAGDPKEIDQFLPRGGKGHIIITSRNPNWNEVASIIFLQLMSSEEAINFLVHHTNQLDRESAKILAKELGYLPLALEQAGAYIEVCGCTIAQYLKLFIERRGDLLHRGKLSQEYQEIVATTWELSFQRVKKESPSAAGLMNLCAFLAPDDIPKKLIEQGAEHLPKSLAAAVQDPVAFNDALAVLRRYSLMEVGDDTLAVHRLVQAVARDRLDQKAKKRWAGTAVELVEDAFPGDMDAKVETWPWCARLLSHGQACAAHAQELKIVLPAAASIFNSIGSYLDIRAEYEAAKQAYERALAIGEAIYEPDNPNIATYANNLGYVLRALGDLGGARSHYERVIAILEKIPNNPNFGGAINNLGSVLCDLGDLGGARAHFERALAIDEAAYGPDHPLVAIRVSNLGGLLQALGDLEGAKAHFERALAIMEKVHGPNHPHVATPVNNLGGVLRDLGDLPGARAHYERALRIDEAAYGPDHPKVAIRVNNLGYVLRDLGDLTGARACAERALAIFRQFLGEDHPQTKLVRDNLAALGLPIDE